MTNDRVGCHAPKDARNAEVGDVREGGSDSQIGPDFPSKSVLTSTDGVDMKKRTISSSTFELHDLIDVAGRENHNMKRKKYQLGTSMAGP